MGNKLYTFILFTLFSCCLSAGAQDSTLCNPNFGFSANGAQVSFQAVDVHSNIQHHWNFGDSAQAGFNSNLASAWHTYSHSGSYIVTHVIKDSLGGPCLDSSTRYVTVSISPSCQVSFVAMKDTVDYHIYNFSSSYLSSGGVHDSISWFINDTLAGTAPTLTNHYFADGNYTICVKLTTSTGCEAEQCGQIYVRNTDSVVHTDSCGITASFSYRTDPSDSMHIYFTPAPDSSVYSYLWSFGDGAYSTLRHADHVYAYGGNYTVYLTVTKHNGVDSCQSNFGETVTVAGAPRETCSISFTYTRGSSNPNEITFNALDSTGTDSLTWLVLNITDSLHPVYLFGRTPTYILPDSGCYLILLSAITPTGCQSSSQQTLCADSVPAAARNFISSYPNPAVSQANLSLNLAQDNTIHISVFNSMGNQILTTVVAGNKGINHISLPISNLPKGVYYVQIQYGNEIRRSKIQKL